jgi:hypothetical protein
MDTFEGVTTDPITLHKYLYANAAPHQFTDPTGNFTLVEVLNVLAVASIELMYPNALAVVYGADIALDGPTREFFKAIVGNAGLSLGATVLLPYLSGGTLSGGLDVSAVFSFNTEARETCVTLAGVVLTGTGGGGSAGLGLAVNPAITEGFSLIGGAGGFVGDPIYKAGATLNVDFDEDGNFSGSGSSRFGPTFGAGIFVRTGLASTGCARGYNAFSVLRASIRSLQVAYETADRHLSN